MPLLIRHASVRPLRARLREPFTISKGATNSIENRLFTITLAGGVRGCGEAAAATGLTGDTRDGVARSLTNATQWLLGRNAADYLALSSEISDRVPERSAVAAIEMALLDALCRRWKMPLFRFFGGASTRIVSDITVVIGSVEQAARFADRFRRAGFGTFKIKTGGDDDLDIARIRAVAAAAPRANITLDPNQAWTVERTLGMLRRIRRAGIRIALLEQPVPREDIAGMRALVRHAKVPICADESVFTLEDAVRVIENRAAHVINIKTMKSGVFRSREIATLARARGLGLMIGGMVESPIAMTFSAHMAAGIGGFTFVDLDIPWLMGERVTKGFHPSRNGLYDLSAVRSGLGLTPQ